MRIVVTNNGRNEINKNEGLKLPLIDKNHYQNNNNSINNNNLILKTLNFNKNRINLLSRNNSIQNKNKINILSERYNSIKNKNRLNLLSARNNTKINKSKVNFFTELKDSNLDNIKFIKLNPKKIIMPTVIQDKYSNNELDKLTNRNIHIFNDLSSSFSEDNLPIYKNKLSLNEVISEKNKVRLQSSKKRINFDKKINIEDSNLLSYLKQNDKLSSSFITKINNYNDDQLFKLNKVCQIHYYNEELRKNLNEKIKKKINWRYEKDSIICRNYLRNMSNNLKNYKNIYDYLFKKENEYYKQRLDFLEKKTILGK